MGWSMPWGGRKCGSIQESPPPEGQPPHAAHSESSGQRRGQVERNHFRDCLSPIGIAPGTQSDHRGLLDDAQAMGLRAVEKVRFAHQAYSGLGAGIVMESITPKSVEGSLISSPILS